jgi:predicted nucleotidyltransferase
VETQYKKIEIIMDHIDTSGDRVNRPNNNSLDGLRAKSHDILMGSLQSDQKVIERRKLLAAHPELRRSIDTGKLKEVIDYVEFKCHPKSSVARGEAIEGSDIDVGVVVLRDRVLEQQELAFVEELRKQGFTAYHQKEYEDLEKQYRNTEVLEERLKLIPEKTIRELDRIHFYTEDELKELTKKPIGIPVVMVYLAGTSIK